MMYFCLIFLLVVATYHIVSTRKKLRMIQLKAEELYHDINSSLVIFKLTQESLKDISLELQNSRLISLTHSLNEAIEYFDRSFQSWDF